VGRASGPGRPERVPAFAKTSRYGRVGQAFASLEPLTKSPVIWASTPTARSPGATGSRISSFKQGEKEPLGGAGGGDSAGGQRPIPGDVQPFWRAGRSGTSLVRLGKKVGVRRLWTTMAAQPVFFSTAQLIHRLTLAVRAWRDWGGSCHAREPTPATLDFPRSRRFRRYPRELYSLGELIPVFVPAIATTKGHRASEITRPQSAVDLRGRHEFYRSCEHLLSRFASRFLQVYFPRRRRGVPQSTGTSTSRAESTAVLLGTE